MIPKSQYYNEEYAINSDGGLDITLEYENEGSYGCSCSSCYHYLDFSLPKEEFAELVLEWQRKVVNDDSTA